ncbi:hypothetical protein KUCAC02_037872, partial [Chaenocephalus aceratus]
LWKFALSSCEGVDGQSAEDNMSALKPVAVAKGDSDRCDTAFLALLNIVLPGSSLSSVTKT